MSYEPTNWKAGDTVTSAKLNKMEQGIANGGIRIVHTIETEEIDETTGNPIVRLDITPNELGEALNNGQMLMLLSQTIDDSISYNKYTILICYAYGSEDEEYFSECTFDETAYISADPDGYFIESRGPK